MTPHPLDIATILIPLTMTGVEIAVALINPVIKRLPSSAYLAISSALASRFGRIMPFWYFATFVLSGMAAWLHSRQTHALNVPMLSATILYAAAILLSVLGLVPLNHRIAAKAGSATELIAVQDAWDRRHLLRLLVLLAAGTLLVHALIM